MNRILAIDDHEDTLLMVEATISSYIPECKVIFASSGYEGIQLARKELPDTILLDIMMPEMNGFEVCETLKRDNKTKHIPIIFFSGHVRDTAGIVKGLDLGAEMFLEKPIQPAELAAQVRVMLRIKIPINKFKGFPKTPPITFPVILGDKKERIPANPIATIPAITLCSIPFLFNMRSSSLLRFLLIISAIYSTCSLISSFL